MSLNSVYVRTSLLAVFFMTLHFTDDVIRKVDGADQGGFAGLLMMLILVVWMYGILWLSERRSGYIINLIISFLGLIIPVGHLTGIGGEATLGQIATSSGPFFSWAVIGLGVTLSSSLIFSAHLLFNAITEKSAAGLRSNPVPHTMALQPDLGHEEQNAS
jgi:hypothetical protein